MDAETMPRPSPHLSPPLLKQHDLEVVSGLLASGFECVGSEVCGDRVYFHFSNDPAIRALLVQLASGEIRFDCHTLIESFRRARRLLLAAKRDAGMPIR
jgi:hypothetical protein